MSQPNLNRGPQAAVTMPKGDAVAAFTDYVDAQRAVDTLSDKAFPVQNLSIIGEGLTMVERVMGRLTTGRVAVGGIASGAWFGLFVGLLLAMFASEDVAATVISGVVIGAGFGLMFALISYAATRGKRDFTSQSQIVATRYVVLCSVEKANEARRLLAEAGIRSTAADTPVVAPAAPAPSVPGPLAPVAPQASPTPSRISSQYVTPDGRPRYGVRTDDVASEAADAPAEGASGAPASEAPRPGEDAPSA
ncbi:general stress protein [Flavimobilis soli]|nr:general stress protein [Flavimobilis soli]